MEIVFRNYRLFLDMYFRVLGFYVGSMAHLAVIFVVAVLLILRKRVKNPILSEILNDDCSEIRKQSHGNRQLASNEIGRLLFINRYSSMGNIGVTAIKIVFGLLFGYSLLEGEPISMIVDPSVSALELLKTDFVDAFFFVPFVLLYVAFQYTMNFRLNRDALVDTSTVDTILMVITAGLCFVAPIGYGVFVLFFTILESGYVWVVNKYYYRTIYERLTKTAKHFKAFSNEYDKKKRKRK